MAFDSAGKYAYFGTSTGVAAYTIDPTTGALTAISGSPFAAGQAGTDNVIIGTAPNRPLLYAANPNDNHLYAFSITSTGALQAVGTAPATGNLPLGLAIDPLSQFVFVSNDVDSTVSPYLINADGSLTAESAVAVGAAPQELAVDPSSHFLFVQDQTGSLGYSGVQTYTIGTNASLTLAQTIGEPFVYPMAILGGSGVTYAPQFLFSADEGYSRVSAYQVDPASGNLTQVTGSPFSSGGSQTLAIVADPLGRFVYAANGSGNPNTVSAFTIGSTGSLTNVTGSPFGSSSFSTQGIAEDASGQFVYVTSGAGNEISEFAVDQTTGALAAISGSPFVVPNGGSGDPSAIANSPFGATLFVTNTSIDTVSALAISASGALSNFNNSPINTGASPQRPVAVAVDPSNRFVYVLNATAQTIAAYQFTDANTVSPVPFAPISGTQFIFSTAPTGSLPTSIAIEPTGRFLYVTTALPPTTGAIEVFQINQTTGALSAVGTPLSVAIPAGAGGMGGGTLQGAAVDPSGKFLYAVVNNEASSPTNSVILEFTIDPTTGALTQQSTNFPVDDAPTSLAFTANIQSNSGPAFAQYSPLVQTNLGLGINFGFVNVGSNATQQLMLTNTGGAPFDVNAISFAGSSSAFSLTNAVCNGVPFSSGVALGPGQTCTLTLQFASTPGQNGAQSEFLVVATTTTNSNLGPGPGGVGQAVLLFGQGVSPITTTTTITSTSASFKGVAIPVNVALLGNPVTVNFTVQPASGGAATGTVTVTDGFSPADSCSGTLGSGAGSCSLTISQLGSGSTALTATYKTDSVSSGLLTSTSSPFTENIVQIVSCGTPVAPQTVTQGGTTTFTFVVCLAGDVNAVPTGSITQNCVPNATCTLTITPVAGQPGEFTVTVTIVTTGTGSSIPWVDPQPRSGPWPLALVGFGTLLAMLMVFLMARQNRARPRLLYGAGLLCAVLLTGMSGCSGGGSKTPTTSANATPLGNYTVNVTITAAKFSTTVPLNLTVTQ
jgi:6-phosphogluconolactonase (cycloisomerase 2 family)